MLGVITKDLYQNFYIKRKRMGMIVSYIVAMAGVLLFRNEYGFVFSTLFYVPFTLTTTLIQVSSERDAVSNYDKIQLTMPVKKTDVITAKYLLGILYSLFNTGFLFVGLLLHITFVKIISFEIGLYMIIASFLLSLFFIAFNYVTYIVLGSKGGIVYASFMLAFLLLYYFFPSLIDYERIVKYLLTMQNSNLIVIGVFISILSVIVSYLISILYYSKKEIS